MNLLLFLHIMDGSEVKNYLNNSNTSDSACILSTIDMSFKSKDMSVEDNRIMCSNSRSLDTVLKIVHSNVEQVSESVNLGPEKQQFVSRVLEIFKDSVQENVTLNGLPYSANKEFFSITQKEEQKDETKDAILTKISKKLEVVADKRKHCPKYYCKLLEKRLHDERHNVKHAKVRHTVHLPTVKRQSSDGTDDLFPSQKLEELSRNFKSSQTKVVDAVNELKKVQKKFEFAKVVTAQKPYLEVLSDTGYNSS